MADSSDIGTMRMITSGSDQLSYCAASTRNTSSTQSGKTKIAVLPASFCWYVSSVHSYADAVRQRLGRADRLHRPHGLARADARRGAAVDVGRRDSRCSASPGPGPYDCFTVSTDPSGTIVTVRVPHLELRDVLGRGAERRVGLRDHLVGAAELVEVVHVRRAEVDLQRLEQVGAAGCRAASTLSRSTSAKSCGTLTWKLENGPASCGV